MESNGVAENHGSSTDIKETTSYPLAIPQRQSIYDMLMSPHELTSNQYSHTVALHRPVTMDNPTSSDDPCSLDQITRRSLPYFLPWQMTASPTQVPPDFGWMANWCDGFIDGCFFRCHVGCDTSRPIHCGERGTTGTVTGTNEIDVTCYRQ
jgi:hypothetical protein